MTFTEREALYGPILRKAFEAEGLPGAWGCAIACQESHFDPAAQVLTGGDGARGGAFGLCQMTLKTARFELDYKGDAQGLHDATVNAQLAAKYCKLLSERLKTKDLKDIAAAYNSGKPFAKAPESTRALYVPQVLTYAKHYEV